MENKKIFENIKFNGNIRFLENLLEVNKDEVLAKDIKLKIDEIYECKHKFSKVNYDSNIFDRLEKVHNLAFKKSWNKLTKEQKLIKINEFFKNQFVDYSKNKNKIKKMILSDFENNILNSNKKVCYDIFSMQITKIEKLEFDNELNEYKYMGKN
jgi:hypothetical protein